jgi:hypothetical protein
MAEESLGKGCDGRCRYTATNLVAGIDALTKHAAAAADHTSIAHCTCGAAKNRTGTS